MGVRGGGDGEKQTGEPRGAFGVSEEGFTRADEDDVARVERASRRREFDGIAERRSRAVRGEETNRRGVRARLEKRVAN